MVNGTWYTAHGGGGLNERLRGGVPKAKPRELLYVAWQSFDGTPR